MKQITIILISLILSACSSTRHVETKVVGDRGTKVFFAKDFSETNGNILNFYGKDASKFKTGEGVLFITAPVGEKIYYQIKTEEGDLIVDKKSTISLEKWTYVRLNELYLETGRYLVIVKFLNSSKESRRAFWVVKKTFLKYKKLPTINQKKYFIPFSTKKFHYTKKGENLWRISMKYNLKMSYLQKLNPSICDSNKIQVGQKIRIK